MEVASNADGVAPFAQTAIDAERRKHVHRTIRMCLGFASVMMIVVNRINESCEYVPSDSKKT
jgi:hypothetical protein